MDSEKIIKSNQEQAVGSWINYLNQERLNKLVDTLSQQTENFKEAIKSIDIAFESIKDSIIDRNRGGAKGMHGFIAEIAECGIGNARQQINGDLPSYSWINDNGPVDFTRAGIDIQQKFVNSGGHLSLQAIREHLSKYPDYISNGGIYQIPEDHYEKIKYLLEMPKEVAYKMQTSDGEFSLNQWREVHQFFESGVFSVNTVEPSLLAYDSVQANRIESTLDLEKRDLENKNEQNRAEAHNESMPNLKEGVQATLISAAIEGGTAFYMSVAKKRKSGKKIKDFDSNDWKDIIGESGEKFIRGGVRGASIYTLTNFTATPAAVASAIVTASYGVADQVHLYRIGKISETEFLENSELLCLDASVSALSSFIGQAIIPIPVLGAVIGNTVGTVMYQIGKDKFSDNEQRILRLYAESMQKLDASLEEEYQELIMLLNKEVEMYMSFMEDSFSANVGVAFEGSINLALSLGIPKDEILDSHDKIKAFFLN